MTLAGTICSLLLLSVLWMELAMAGASFRSPEHHSAQQRKESRKLPAKIQPRELEDWPRPEGRGKADAAREELETQFNVPLDIGVKLSGAQYQQHSQALGKLLQAVLGEEAEEAPADK
uniref:Appetite-regulating hormone n=2 Tax=Cavia porcellus TaxID=10141 RepID=H0WA56_CAVPO|nr:appetite-regulating hormone isoform X1 [Cavia porcellus]BBB05297.1 ghrelin [Cavia porcellus]